ncbi:hypothetical protein GCM10007981_12390 [Thermocladium modestius]|uniref:Uncharacterized protein n=1 Tax=Thermocladium modestius TaxID=62609 RepID=A0A830GWN0_9CREN|nr:hypothetical protein GCM10007981_12390 [Thermocladium modestius]
MGSVKKPPPHSRPVSEGEEIEEELLRLVEETQLIDAGNGLAIYVDAEIPNCNDFTVVPIYHVFEDAAILEIWVECHGPPMRFALIDEVKEHVDAVNEWITKGRMLLAFRSELISLPLPPNVKPMMLFTRVAGPGKDLSA